MVTNITLPETNSKFAPENRPSYSNHPFLGAKMLVSGRVHNHVVHSTVLSMNVDFIHSDWEMSRFVTLALKKIGSLSCIRKINQCSNQLFLDFLTIIHHFEVPKKTLSYGIILIGPYGIHTF